MTVKSLFRTFSQFNVPVFQRDYSWDKQYYSKFIDDIIHGITVKDDQLETSKYFIGTMVFAGDTGDNIIDVVDGQQRLTVITILLSVISEQLLKIGEKGLATATFKYVKEKNDNDEYIRHLISDTSYPYLDSFIQSLDKKNSQTVQTDEEKNLKDTYTYFSKRLSPERIEELAKFKKVEYKEILISIRDQVLSSMVISILTPDRDNAFMIFEILNAKGKNLVSIDLIKNVLFEEFHNDPNGLESNAEIMWEKIKSNLRTRDQSVGLATFYRHYWISKYKKVTNAKLYDSFKTEIKGSDKKQKYYDFIVDLEKESRNYIAIIHPILSEDYDNRQEYRWLEQSLNALNDTFGLVQTRVALLALMDVKERKLISPKKFKEAINYIENIIFMHTGIAKKQANIYESRFSILAINLRKTQSKNNTSEIINKHLYNAFSDKELTYQEFEKGFIEQTYKKGKYNTNLLTKYIIKKIGCYFQDEELFIPNNSIEHILNEDSDYPQTMGIGNLLLLETVLNNKAGNSMYAEKKGVYLESKNKQVEKFVESYNTFSIDDIEKRSVNLSKWYYKNILKKV
ncbi:DUF262 domain-containing protein [Brochothrix thermosphacta]|uniref:DUF262 domain-containing protein n=1 Tax=Brochothrix thermosphacta TaxID=2756 RepID=UPI00241DAEC1|nr:DUF262 domain-containing protein [Brochothrix thermosphacta]